MKYCIDCRDYRKAKTYSYTLTSFVGTTPATGFQPERCSFEIMEGLPIITLTSNCIFYHAKWFWRRKGRS